MDNHYSRLQSAATGHCTSSSGILLIYVSWSPSSASALHLLLGFIIPTVEVMEVKQRQGNTYLHLRANPRAHESGDIFVSTSQPSPVNVSRGPLTTFSLPLLSHTGSEQSRRSKECDILRHGSGSLVCTSLVGVRSMCGLFAQVNYRCVSHMSI